MGKSRTFKIKSLRTILVLPFGIAFIIAVILIAILIISDSQKAVNKVINELRHTMISMVENDLNSKLDQVIQLNQIHKDAFVTDIINLEVVEERERYFSAMLKNYPEVVMTYIGLIDGQFYGARRNTDGTIEVVRNNEGTKGNSEYYTTNTLGEGTELTQVFENFDPRKRPWYIKALETKEISFTPLYNHFVFKETTVTASLPIYEGDTLIGVFGVDYLMTWLGETLNELPIGENGQVFIIDEKNQLVATTTGEAIFKILDNQSINILANESTNLVTKKIVEMSETQIDRSLPRIDIDGDKYLFGIDRYDKYGIEWRIYTVIKENDFLHETNKTVAKAIQSTLALSVIFIIFMFVLTNQIVRPIIYLKESAKKLSEGVFVEVKINGRADEISELAQSFNHMGKQLSELVDNLEKEVVIRTLELEEKNNILNNLSYIDGLSQISNRRKFDDYIKQVLEASSRKRSLSLMMMDIDNFKLFNDTYGHIAGDECIKAIGAVLSNCIIRSSDLVARYGGEEFVVVVQDYSLEAVQKIAETIRYEIQALNIKHDKTEVGVVTVSIGVVYCEIIAGTESVNRLLQRADEALYRAKDNGRNRIEFEEV